jgi:hypothetical protein
MRLNNLVSIYKYILSYLARHARSASRIFNKDLEHRQYENTHNLSSFEKHLDTVINVEKKEKNNWYHLPHVENITLGRHGSPLLKLRRYSRDDDGL